MNIRSMKRLVTILIAFFLYTVVINAQQQGLYTQFMYNKMVFNPGYVGSLEAPAASLIHRSQWIGFEGRPESTSLSYQTNVNDNKIGLGGAIFRHSIGIHEDISLMGVYTYRIKLGKASHLGLGLAPSIKHWAIKYTDERIKATQGTFIDNSISDVDESKFVANIGFGLYYHSERFFLGISAPRLARADLDFDSYSEKTSVEALHFYLMTGYAIPLSRYVELTPQVMVRYVENAPFDFDANLMLSMAERYHLGVTYRSYHGVEKVIGESIDVMAAVNITKSFLVGFAYDVSVSPLRTYHSGSLEFAARYLFLKPEARKTYKNPRYF